jgi:uncharacterized protein YcbK (DUF882 family)
MISVNELLSGNTLEDQSEEIQKNLEVTSDKLSKVRAKYGKPLRVTSGLRTMEHHLEIYRKKAETAGVPFDESKVPMKSKHLYGEAGDLVPVDGDVEDFKQWCIDNDDFLREVGIWMEAFHSTPTWVHMQSVKYGSFVEGGSLQFNP